MLAEAWERVGRARCRFVVTEADHDGLDLVRRVNQEQPEVHVVSVGLPGPAEMERAKDLDAWTFPTPLDLRLLRRTVRMLLVVDRLRLQVAKLESEPSDEEHQVDELWFSIFDRLRKKRPSHDND